MRYLIVALCVIGHAALCLAGPLDPPAGPIAPTPGPEPRTAINAINTPGDADSLYKITQPGSYYLTGNLSGVSGRAGIEVSTAGGAVTIDLQGFSVVGVAGALDGINNASGVPLTVRNGTVSNWPGNGVEVSVASNLRVTNNGEIGIFGFDFAFISDCQVISNGAVGSYGIQTGTQVIISDCIVRANGSSNGGGGINCGLGSQVLRCTISGNAPCTGTATGFGLAVGTDATVADCRVNSNGGASPNSGGIFVSAGTSVVRCTLYSNANVGLQSAGEGLVSENSIGGTNGSPGVGILINGPRGRIEANHLFANLVGIRVLGGGSNTIIRNSVRGSATPYDIAGSNDVGPIGTAATASSPWANLQGP